MDSLGITQLLLDEQKQALIDLAERQAAFEPRNRELKLARDQRVRELVQSSKHHGNMHMSTRFKPVDPQRVLAGA